MATVPGYTAQRINSVIVSDTFPREIGNRDEFPLEVYVLNVPGNANMLLITIIRKAMSWASMVGEVDDWRYFDTDGKELYVSLKMKSNNVFDRAMVDDYYLKVFVNVLK